MKAVSGGCKNCVYRLLRFVVARSLGGLLMGKVRLLDKSLKMVFLRWIFFFPALLLVTAAVQTIGGIVGEQGPWWIWFFVYAAFGWAASAWAVFMASRICPDPKVGSYMFLGLFIVAELIGYSKSFTARPALENIIRGGIDIGIVGSLIASANIATQGARQ